MNIWQIIVIVVGIAILMFLALLVFSSIKNGKGNPLSPLMILAMGLTATGITFNSERLLGYSMLGAGIVISLIEIVRLTRRGAP